MADRFQRAIELIDEENSRDPNKEWVDGREVPRELLYSERLTAWIEKLDQNASEALRLAARSQHIGRWKIARAQYPEGRAGYLRWRTDLKKLHAETTASILQQVGYDEETISRVRALNLKADFPSNPEARMLEDALCLVFLEFQFAELSKKIERQKLINALQKSWGKMTDRARSAALELPFSAEEKELIASALQVPQGNA